MRHLTTDELVDLVDGTVVDSNVPHLATCDACRQQLAELRVTLAAARSVAVPEPSPLFWEHFSTRVREAVAADAPARDGWWRRAWSWPGVLMPVSAVAAAMLVVAVSFYRPIATPEVHAPAPIIGSASIATAPLSPDLRVELLSDSIAPDDPSLTLVADLTTGLGSDGAAEAGLAAAGSAEHAVTHLSGDELLELQRLLKEELGRTGN